MAIAGTESNSLEQLTGFGGVLFYQQNGKLMRSDGTANGTVLVKDAQVDFSGYIASIVNVGSTLYFVMSRNEFGAELWKSNGTVDGTVLVKAFPEAAPGPNFQLTLDELTELNNTLYFWANDAATGPALWRSNGTPAGTTLVKNVDIYMHEMGTNPLVRVGDKLFFSAHDDHGVELWTTDGTAGGTGRVKDIFPGQDVLGNLNNSYPRNLTSINGQLYFTAHDGFQGFELWRSNGTTSGTVRVKSLYPGADGSLPADFTYSGGKLYFTADDFTHGRELWSLDVGPPVVTSGNGTTTINGGTIQIVTPGDFDGDHDVDGADFVVWQTNFSKANGATRSQGDADGDGDVDGADFVVWQTHFGA